MTKFKEIIEMDKVDRADTVSAVIPTWRNGTFKLFLSFIKCTQCFLNQQIFSWLFRR